MKGVNYVVDEKQRIKAVQIDIRLLTKFDQDLVDLLDIIIATSRKDEPKSSFDAVKKRLKKKGKL